MARQPLKWFGGKYHLSRHLIHLIPEHHTYVEVFGGGAALLFAKPPSPVEVYNDIDESLVNFFAVLRDPEKMERLKMLLALTPYSRQEWWRCVSPPVPDDGDDVERARRFFVSVRRSMPSNIQGSWGFCVHRSVSGMAEAVYTYLSAICSLPEFHSRIMRVQIENRDWREILDTYDSESTFFYLDPPYVLGTRRGGGYQHELSEQDHKELIERLLQIKGMAMLSGYRHPIHRPLEDAGWMRMDFPTVCHAAPRTRRSNLRGEGAVLQRQRRVESVWMNYRPPTSYQLSLFDAVEEER